MSAASRQDRNSQTLLHLLRMSWFCCAASRPGLALIRFCSSCSKLTLLDMSACNESSSISNDQMHDPVFSIIISLHRVEVRSGADAYSTLCTLFETAALCLLLLKAEPAAVGETLAAAFALNFYEAVECVGLRALTLTCSSSRAMCHCSTHSTLMSASSAITSSVCCTRSGCAARQLSSNFWRAGFADCPVSNKHEGSEHIGEGHHRCRLLCRYKLLHFSC